MKTKLIFGLLLTVFTIITVSIALKSCDLNPEPNREEIHEIIKKKADSVVVASVLQPDSAKLRKLKALKIRIAKARFDDSLQRAKNK